MTDDIAAIFFDMGGTLRTVVPDPELRQQGLTGLVDLLNIQEPPEAFLDRLSQRARAHKRWAEDTLLEASEVELWTRWLLPDRPFEEVAPRAARLTRLWRMTQGRRVVRPEAAAVIAELVNRGYCLGLVSNTSSPLIVPQALAAYGMSDYFPVVVLSCTYGRRKPDPTIFLEAARQMGVSPARSAYVGDRHSRDVVGPHRAGFGMSILIKGHHGLPEGLDMLSPQPDLVIHSLDELLAHFRGASPC